MKMLGKHTYAHVCFPNRHVFQTKMVLEAIQLSHM